VLISESVATRCTSPLAAAGSHSLRGSISPVALYTLPEISPKQNADRY
jgi:hypothetical protein